MCVHICICMYTHRQYLQKRKHMTPSMKDQGKGDGGNSPRNSENCYCPQTACQCWHGWGEGGSAKARKRWNAYELFVKLREDKDAVHNSTNNYCRSWKSEWLVSAMRTEWQPLLMQHSGKSTTEGNILLRVEWTKTKRQPNRYFLLWRREQSHKTRHLVLLPVLPLGWYNGGHGGKLNISKTGLKQVQGWVFNWII